MQRLIFLADVKGLQVSSGMRRSASRFWQALLREQAERNALGLPKRILHGDSSKEDQFDFFMNKNPRKYEWYADPQGTVTAGWGLCMSARDMAVIGELVLDGGLYKDRRIISEEYLKDMTKPHLKLGERFGYMNYGYLWYKPFDDREVYAAIGDSGNIIYVNKEENVSVGITGTFKPRIFDRVDFIEQTILAVI